MHHDRDGAAEAQNRRDGISHAALPEATPATHDLSALRPSTASALMIITLLAAVLYLPAINWGLPGYNSWSQDTIAGPNRTYVVKDWPDKWMGKYPPLHYFVNAKLYGAIETYWQWRGWMTFDPATGNKVLAPPQLPKLGFLILASHIVTWLMAVGTGLGLFVAGRRLTGDPAGALWGALFFMGGADFAYFARLGNVDVPSMFWFAWALAAYARLLESERTRDGILLGLLSAAAVATKDGVVGALPGMAAVLVLNELMWRRSTATDQPAASTSPRWRDALLKPAFLWGLAAFIVPVLYINGAFHNWHGLASRLHYWLDESADTVQARQHRYGGQLALLGATLRYAGAAVGWPMLAALLLGVANVLRRVRRRRLALVVLAPAVSYYLLTIDWAMGFVYARFLFPMLALASIPTGLMVAEWLRNRKIPFILRYLAVIVFALPSLAYTSAVSLEMLTDSRYDAEEWMTDHVPPGAKIGVFSKPQYLPRLLEMNYDLRDVRMDDAALATTDADWLVVSSFEAYGDDERQAKVQGRLLSGQCGFDVAATFTGRGFLDQSRCVLALPAIGTEPVGKISPRVTVLRRIQQTDR